MLKPYLNYVLNKFRFLLLLPNFQRSSRLRYQSPPFYRVAKVTIPIIMTKTFCKILTNFIAYFLRTFRLFISGLQRYTLSTLLPNLFALYFNYFLSKNCSLFYRRVAKVRVR